MQSEGGHVKSAHAPARRPRISRGLVNYRPRILGAGLCGIMLLSIDAGDRFVSLAVQAVAFGFAWPHIAYWFASMDATDRREKINVIVDAFLGGLAVAAVAGRLWPS